METKINSDLLDMNSLLYAKGLRNAIKSSNNMRTSSAYLITIHLQILESTTLTYAIKAS